VGTPFTQGHEILSRNTRDTKLSYGENPKSKGTVPGRDGQTDRQTDRQNYRS